ncbi:MAG: hypothetical protein AAF798_11490 [Bacteroidota bacterium]
MRTTPLSATLVFTLLNFLQPAVNVFLLPLYLQVLPAEEYAIYTFMNNLSSLIIIIGALRVSAAVITYYFDFSYNRQQLDAFMSTVTSFSLLAALSFFGASLLLGPFLFDWLFKDESLQFFPYGILAIGSGLLYVVFSPYLLFVKNEKRVGHFALLQVLLVALTVGLQVWLILGLRQGAFGALLAKLIAHSVLAVVILALVRKWLVLRWPSPAHWLYLRKALYFSIPLLPFLIINWLNVFGDRFFVERYFDLTTLGTYGVLMTIAGMIPMALDAVINGIRPFLFDYFSKGIPQHQSAIDQLFQLYFAVMALAISGIILVGTNIGLITNNPDYLAIIPYLPVAALLYASRAYIFLFNQQLMYSKQTALISTLSIVLLILLALAFFTLIPRFGIWGALAANGGVSAVVAVLFGVVAQRPPIAIGINGRIFWLQPSLILFTIALVSVGAYAGYYSFPQFGIYQFILTLFLLFLFLRNELLSLI